MASRPFFIALLPLLLPLLGACSANETNNPGGAGGGGGSGGGGAGGTGGAQCTDPVCPFPYAGWNGATPVVSLRQDLLADADKRPGGGVLRRACAFSACHDETPEADLFIGPVLKDTEQMNVTLTDMHVQRLLGATDGVLRTAGTTGMPLVDPGKPENSFLMRKIDGCFTGLQCTPLENGPPPCGERMPDGAAALCNDERDMIRRWIFQGAKDG